MIWYYELWSGLAYDIVMNEILTYWETLEE